MTTPAPTFVREGNKVLAFYEDRLIAEGTVFSAVEQSALEYLDNLTAKKHMQKEEARKASATHIETPSGMKGEILGRHDGTWGEKLVTVRWENGRISRYQAHGGNDDKIAYQTVEQAQPESALEYLQSTLDEVPEGTRESLASRIASLDDLVVRATAFQRTASYEEQRSASEIVIAAEHEKREVREALAHLELADAEAFAPPAPFRTGAVEQASLGGGSGTWLDATVDDMIAEASAQDFDKILAEEPGQFVAGLETGVIADTGATRDAAHDFITSKLAGTLPESQDSFRQAFLAKVEQARREELAVRSEAAREAATKVAHAEEQVADTEDEALFL
jgi:hypothetical protein